LKIVLAYVGTIPDVCIVNDGRSLTHLFHSLTRGSLC
jgi:hypothetical protein